MKELFLEYQEALELKELGFDQPCFTSYDDEKRLRNPFDINEDYINCVSYIEDSKCFYKSSELLNGFIAAPLYQQAFDWFRKEHNALAIIFNDDGDVEFGNICFNYEIRFITISFKEKQKSSVVGNYRYNTYEEVRLACLQELIKIVKK